MYATGATSTFLTQDSAAHPQLLAHQASALAELSRIEPIAGGVRLVQPYGREWRHRLALMGMGAAFAGMGAVARVAEAPTFFFVVFAGIGAALMLWQLYALSNSLRVQLDHQGLRTERRLLGLLLSWQQVPESEIERLVLKEGYTVHHGTKPTTFYRAQVRLRNGKAVTIADSLRGRAVAEQLLARVSQATGYPA